MLCQDFFEDDDHPVPLLFRYVQVNVGIFHAPPIVLTGPACGLANQSSDLILEVRSGNQLPGSINSRILVHEGVGHDDVDKVVDHD